MTKRAVSVIYDEDTTEIQWSTTEPEQASIDGYVQVDADGRLVVPFVSPDGEPFVFVLGGLETGIYASEDAVAVQTHPPVWEPGREV